ncbi:MAG: hypothetical protein COC19_08220 [SAR86 cluster bacterium]|uniref:Cupin 2 conserved barrel domain-containing protein n=1 Tax=SAR86 cluster bacterium TaxID=2030880 RepID=A0A2A4MGQ0_9GAMM|nr:MAG: hypothetical protein COC19_08220 [SAR86 cluster bacterium]
MKAFHVLVSKPLLATFTFFTLISSGFFIAVNAQEDQWEGLRVVPLLQEPRHRTVHRDGDIYLLDVQINAGDTSLPHIHESAIMYTFISNGEGPLYGRVSGNTDYVSESLTHRVSNEGPGLFRIIALTNFGPGQAELDQGRPMGLDMEPQLENAWFRSYRLKIESGQFSELLTHTNPAAIVQVSEGVIHVSRSDGITTELDAMGEFAWSPANSAYKLHNASDHAIEVVINEARR